MKYRNIPVVLIALLLVASCTKVQTDDDFTPGDPPPVPGGYTNSDQIAPDNLLAYWSFDEDNNEIKSNTAPVVSNAVSSVKGIKGQGVKFDQGYILYPTIAALSKADAVASFTVSLWVNTANRENVAECFFSLTQQTSEQSDWGAIINVGAETGKPVSNTNLTFHSWVGTYSTGSRRVGDNINDYGTVGVDYQTVNGANAWVHYLVRYDGAESTLDFYTNSIRSSNNNFRVRPGLGPVVAPTPTQILLGAFPNDASGYPKSGVQSWQGKLIGSLDEIKVFNKALSDVEISALYKLERQGR